MFPSLNWGLPTKFFLPLDHLSPHPNSSYLPPLVSEELSGILNNLLIRQLGVGLLMAEGESLPQSHPKGPHIACCGEFALLKEKKRESEQARHKKKKKEHVKHMLIIWNQSSPTQSKECGNRQDVHGGAGSSNVTLLGSSPSSHPCDLSLVLLLLERIAKS